MEVNDELGALEEGLRVLTARLEPGARIAVITFHSLEDRIVKNFFRDHSREWLDQPEWPEPKPNPDYDLTLDHLEAGRAERRGATQQSALAQREVARGGENRMSRSRRKNWNMVNAAFAGALDRGDGVPRAHRAELRLSERFSSIIWATGRRRWRTSWPSLRTQNEVASVQIAALTSRSALQRRLKEGYLKMIPIAERNIVRLNHPARPANEDAVQPVANQTCRTDEVEQPISLHPGLPRVHRALQRLLFPARFISR